MNYAQLIDELNSLSTSKIYTNDCMNWKKVRNAIAKYAPAVNENDVCLLIDDTVFGSGKAGLLMDKTHIYVKEDFEETFCISHEDVKSINFSSNMISRNLLINGRKVKDFTQPDRSDLDNVFQLLRKYFSSTKQESLDQLNNNKNELTETTDFNHDNTNLNNEQNQIPIKSLRLFKKDNVYLEIQRIEIKHVSELEILMLKNNSEAKLRLLKNIIKNDIIKSVIRVRTEFFEAKGHKFFSNNIATKENIIINLIMLKFNLEKIGYDKFKINAILSEGLLDIFGRQSNEVVNNIQECVNAITIPHLAIISFFARLYFGNTEGIQLDAIEEADIGMLMLNEDKLNAIMDTILEVTGSIEYLTNIFNMHQETAHTIQSLLK